MILTNSTGRIQLKKILTYFVIGIAVILLFCGLLLAFSAHWLIKTYGLLTIDEIVYHLKTSVAGTSSEMIIDYLVGYAIWAVLITALACIVCALVVKKKPKFCLALGIAVSLMGLGCTVYAYRVVDVALGVSEYLDQEIYTDPKARKDYVAELYVDTSGVNIKFPKRGQKRNLIYIYLESVENTFADEADGGAFEQNYIPELTELAQENENFSGGDLKLNGGIALPGAHWTAGAMFAQSSGLPLKFPVSFSKFQDSFFPTIITIGDLLEKEGYNQTFLMGSDAQFADMSHFYSSHGHFKIRDYQYAIANGDIPKDYYEWWGYEDAKLYEYARDELCDLASKDAPFNLTMITADTHCEDGYFCKLCGNTFGDDQYANVIACGSKQLAAFVEWLKKQDFYENTTVVINGDHPTMDSDFCKDVPLDYLRTTYTCILNSASQNVNSNTRRSFSTMDLFPTTLAALGCTIDGDQLGLGVNLYSGKETLVEKYGVSDMKTMLSRPSSLMNQLSEVSFDEAVMDDLYARMLIESANEDGFIKFTVRRLDRVLARESIDRLYLCAIYTDPKTGDLITKTYDCDIALRNSFDPHKYDGTALTDIPYDQLESAQVYVYISVGNFQDYFVRQYSRDDELEEQKRMAERIS